MHIDPLLPFLVGLVLSILILGFLLKWMRQPEIIGYLLAGVVVGPHGLGFITDPTTVNHMGALGVTLLLFFIGMEVSPHKLVQGWRVAIVGTLLQILVSIGLVWMIGWMFNWSLARIVLLEFVISLRSRPRITSRYCAAMSFVFKARRRAHSRAYVTVASTQKTGGRASRIGQLFLDGSLAARQSYSSY